MNSLERARIAVVCLSAVVGAVVQEAFGWRVFAMSLILAVTVHTVLEGRR